MFFKLPLFFVIVLKLYISVVSPPFVDLGSCCMTVGSNSSYGCLSSKNKHYKQHKKIINFNVRNIILRFVCIGRDCFFFQGSLEIWTFFKSIFIRKYGEILMLPTCKINYNTNVDNRLITMFMQPCKLFMSFCEYAIICKLMDIKSWQFVRFTNSK